MSFDFFISYTGDDAAWAEWIAWQLESDGHSTRLQAWDFRPGRDWVHEIQSATRDASRIIAVLSPAYLRSAHGEAEWRTAYARDPSGELGVLIPVRVASFAPPGLLTTRVWIDLVGLDEKNAREALLRGVQDRRARPSRAPSFPGLSPPEFPPNEALPPSSGDEVLNAVGARLRAADIHGRTRAWLLEDRIRETGGWGLSQSALFERLTGVPLTALERVEGGIISTYTAVRSLHASEGDADLFRSREYAREALQYFLERQTPRGGFGRRVRSRSGVEILPSLRHTAFAVAALQLLGGPAEASRRALRYIRENADSKAWVGEAAPSLAVAGLLHAAAVVPGMSEIVDDPTREALEEVLVDLATRQTAPLWPPYGGLAAMAADTALTTIELLPVPTPATLRPTVLRALLYIGEGARSGGVPYDRNDPTPDIGLSGMLLSILTRRVLAERFGSAAARTLLETLALDLADYLATHWDDAEHRVSMYADTVSYLLMMDEIRVDAGA